MWELWGRPRTLIEPGGNLVMTRLVRTGREEIVFAVIALKVLCDRLIAQASGSEERGANLEGIFFFFFFFFTNHWRNVVYLLPSFWSLRLKYILETAIYRVSPPGLSPIIGPSSIPTSVWIPIYSFYD